MRAFGVDEELLLVCRSGLAPFAVAEEAAGRADDPILRREQPALMGAGPARWSLATGLYQEQVEVAAPAVLSFAEQLAAIRVGRSVADAAARGCGARVVALASAVHPGSPHVTADLRHRRIVQRFGLLARDQLTCGLHMHVEVGSREEGVAILDRIRVWLPVLLAMSTNSPFWKPAGWSWPSPCLWRPASAGCQRRPARPRRA